MHEDMLSWPTFDVFHTTEPDVVNAQSLVWCTRVTATFENIPAIAEHYRWNVIGMVAV